MRNTGGQLVQAPDRGPLPFRAEAFDLVTARHPTTTPWSEIGRVLAEGGTFLSQQIGPGSLRGLTEAFLGPQPASDSRSPQRAVEQARAAGLEVLELRSATLETTFYDVGAVVAFLRKVVWIVPGFTPAGFEAQLRRLHEHIGTHGAFVTQASRFLIRARKGDPGRAPGG